MERLSLLSTDYNVVKAKHGLEALTILKEQPIDIILADLNMPVMDGIEMIETIKNTEELNIYQ